MNTHRHTRAQRLAWVQAKANKTKKVKAILEEAGISRATLYTWIDEFKAEAAAPPAASPQKKKTIAVAEAADETGRYEMLKAALAYTDKDGAATKKIIQALIRRYTISIAQACAIAGADPAQYQQAARKPEVEDALVHAELARLLAEDPDRSFEDCQSILRATHPSWSRKQLRRIYRDERLYRQRRRRNTPVGTRLEARSATTTPPAFIQRPGATWHIGAVIHQQQWTLFITDIEDRTLLNTLSGRGLPNEDDIRALLAKGYVENGAPRKLQVPGVPPFNQRPITAWAWEQKVGLVTLSMGKEENLALQGELEAMVQEAMREMAMA